jgi:hypothetical protein
MLTISQMVVVRNQVLALDWLQPPMGHLGNYCMWMVGVQEVLHSFWTVAWGH